MMVSEEELALIQERMAEASIRNMGAYMRKMALNGYVAPCRPVTRPGAGAAPAAGLQQLKSGSNIGKHLRRYLPGGDHGLEKVEAILSSPQQLRNHQKQNFKQ